MTDLPPHLRPKKTKKTKLPASLPAANDAKTVFGFACLASGISCPESEYYFFPSRGWRFDWAWPNHLVALEVEGGAFKGPGHRSVNVFLKNIEKYNAAAIAGWALLRCTTKMFDTGEALRLVVQCIEGRANVVAGGLVEKNDKEA